MTDKQEPKELPRQLPNVQAAAEALMGAFAKDGLEIAGLVVCGVPAGTVGSVVVTCLKDGTRGETTDGQPVEALSGLLEQAVRGIHDHARQMASAKGN